MPDATAPGSGSDPHKLRDGVLIAVIALIAGLGAAAGGALISRDATLKGQKVSRDATLQLQQQEFQHERDAESDVARGLARVMIADLDGAVKNLCDIGHREGWFVAFVPLRAHLGAEDRRVLASHLSTDEWQTVAATDVRLGTWEAAQRGVIAERVDPVSWGFRPIIRRLGMPDAPSNGSRASTRAAAKSAATTRDGYGHAYSFVTRCRQVPRLRRRSGHSACANAGNRSA